MVNLGVFDEDNLVANLRVSTDARRSSDEYGLMIRDLLALNGVDRATITDVCMCSVVPPLTGVFEELSETYFHVKSLSVTAGVRTGLQISYDNPRDVGADRIVDAVAAINLYGQPIIHRRLWYCQGFRCCFQRWCLPGRCHRPWNQRSC